MGDAAVLSIGISGAFLLEIIILVHFRNLEKKNNMEVDRLNGLIQKSEQRIRAFQNRIKKINQSYEEFSNLFVFIPSLISKLTSHNEEKDTLSYTLNWINTLLKPTKAYIFIKKKGHWIAAGRLDCDDPLGQHKFRKLQGIMSVAHDLRTTIDTYDFSHLSAQHQKAFLDDPCHPIKIQVCSPLVYGDEVHGMIALSGMQNYCPQRKVLLRMISDLTANSLVNSALFSRYKGMARKDPLTGLINKADFERELLEAVLRGNEGKSRFSIFIFDIDHFKNFNDKNGHQVGDTALRITAQLVEESFRSGDVKARYGGEEFIVLLWNVSYDEAYELADNFRLKVELCAYPNEQNQPGGRLTISGGISSFPVHSSTTEELIRKADQALYTAKKEGRNRVGIAPLSYFSEETDFAAQYDLSAMVTDLPENLPYEDW